MGTLLNRRRYMGGLSEPVVQNYLRLTAIDECVFTLTLHTGQSAAYTSDVSYSIDEGRTWVKTQNVTNTQVVITTPTISAGNSVLWKGHSIRWGYNTSNFSSFYGSGRHTASGNVAYLFNESDTMPNVNNYTFAGMFMNDTNLVSAEDLIIPNTVPNTITHQCLRLFYGCTSLVTSPILDFTILGNYHLSRCFQGCSSIEKITMLATDISSSSCLSDWMYQVKAGGTLYKNPNTALSAGSRGIPSSWTVIDYQG